MQAAQRSSRRLRQACEPCRRKKSRCPAERPVCSHCARLGQRCTYASIANRGNPSQGDVESPHQDHGSPRSMGGPVERGERGTYDRLSVLESQMVELQAAVNRQTESTIRTSAVSTPHVGHSSQGDHSFPVPRLPTWDVIQSTTQMYLEYCNYQPLPLFSAKSLTDTLTSRDFELLLSILALATRFAPPTLDDSMTTRLHQGEKYAHAARDLVIRRVRDGPVELSTIQSLCILSLFEFNNGNTPWASTYSSLAMDLSMSAGLASDQFGRFEDSASEERRRCYWSVVFLKNLHGLPVGALVFFEDEKTPRVPESPEAPLGSSSLMTDAALEQPEGLGNLAEPRDLGVVAYAIQLSQVWQRAARYAHRRGKPDSVPGWCTDSEYAKTVAQLMQLEAHLPYKYRFRPARFEDQTPERLTANREFWAAWFQVQILYHSILCLLNHPLLLALRLRNFRVTMVPEVFLQHTADLTATHTEWIIHLIDLAKRKSFQVTDPFLAHCAAVPATIYLQQSYSDDPVVRSTKQEYFQKCVAFIRDLGHFWPALNELAAKLERFEKVVSASFHNTAPLDPQPSRVFIDLTLFWDIIESSFVGELPKAADSYFGVSLTSHRQTPHSGEVLRSQLLPEPTRIRRVNLGPTSQDTGSPGSLSRLTGSAIPDLPPANPTFIPSGEDDVAILAQSFFAQGQDFVGNMDDWWNQA